MRILTDPKTADEISFEQRAKELKDLERQEQEQLRQEHKSHFRKFYQVNKEYSVYLRKCLQENPAALNLLLFLFDHMDRYNAVMASYKVFQESLGMSARTTARSIKYLKDHGFIHVYKSGTSNIYVANDDLVWNSWGSNARYCEFPANIVLSYSEQVSTTRD